MMRQTSLDAFEGVKHAVAEKRLLVFWCFKAMERAATDLEVSRDFRIPINEVTPRRGELVKQGLIVECGKKKNAFSGRYATLWKPA